jgi:regulator of sirC expression with transglutaminase-like and TPR domain
MRLLLSFLLLASYLSAASPPSLPSLYATLDPTSVSQHFAFYELYPKTPEGRRALKHAWELLSGGAYDSDPELILPTLDVQPIIALVNRSQQENAPVLNDEQLAVIEKLARHLGNRKLQGFGLFDQQMILSLQPEETDLARGLLLAELGSSYDAQMKIRSYEASLDLMALQILARLNPESSHLEKLRAINDYIFSEMRFRFPPHSLYAKEIDVYTFLPSVLDSRRGVCLGVSILYLSLAQRLELPLQAITPPGHIYVRYVHPDGSHTNIETTARGIDVPSEMYLGIETCKLQERNIREVIGLAFMNQAAVSWHKGDPKTAVALYEKARPFLDSGNDYLLNLFLGFNYLFIGKEAEGRALLETVYNVVPDHAITKDTIAEDYLAGLIDADGINAVFSEVDETRGSILNKQKKLQEVVNHHPKFRQGLLHLAVTYLQLGREKEALPLLERYIQIYPGDPTVNYYLSAIQFQRRHYNQAWIHLRSAEKIVHSKSHRPKALTELRRSLERVCPEKSP